MLISNVSKDCPFRIFLKLVFPLPQPSSSNTATAIYSDFPATAYFSEILWKAWKVSKVFSKAWLQRFRDGNVEVFWQGILRTTFWYPYLNLQVVTSEYPNSLDDMVDLQNKRYLDCIRQFQSTITKMRKGELQFKWLRQGSHPQPLSS